MKTRILFVAVSGMLLCLGSVRGQGLSGEVSREGQQTLNVACSPSTEDLARAWANAYNLTNPETRVELQDQFTAGNLMILEGNQPGKASPAPEWRMLVGRRVVVPVIHSNNPYLADLQQRGVTSDALATALGDPQSMRWATLLGQDKGGMLKVYVAGGEGVMDRVSAFLGGLDAPMEGMQVLAPEEVMLSVQEDPLAIGFINVAGLLPEEGLPSGLTLLPIDRNGNGQIDPVEDIYTDLSHLLRGVWIGKYPRALVANIYAAGASTVAEGDGRDFLRWVLADGQPGLAAFGLCALEPSEGYSAIARLEEPQQLLQEQSGRASSLLLALAVILGVAVIALLVRWLGIARPRPRMSPALSADHASAALDESSLASPEGLLYDKTHTWAFMEKDGKVSVGLDDFLQHVIGPVTRVMLKDPGESVRKGEVLFSVMQSGKQLHIYSPISGTIIRQNEQLRSHTSPLNDSPYAEGWVYAIEPSNWNMEVQLLQVADRYRRWISTEFSRVKDFFATRFVPESPEYAYVALQDGGTLRDGVLSEFGPQIWEDFQSEILDSNR
ncbi:MAG TPA: hypothetical protein P5248_08210 [Bacteroidales bacterium]|nr:hypothetical protein [Bacteroidales bacterium]